MSTDGVDQAACIAVTGASGFIGGALLKSISSDRKYVVRAIYRSSPALILDNCKAFVCGALDAQTDFSTALDGVDVVVHCAARVHVMSESASDPMTEFRAANVVATENLARTAARCGAKRFIFISSIKVNGEATPFGIPYHADDLAAPADPYGLSKLEAENALKLIAAETGMDVVIIRPVLVYGPGVKANFRNMMKWLSKGAVLPFGAINNRRSLVSLYNLTDFIRVCLTHPAAANRIFLVSDGEDVSTTQLLTKMARALGRRARLIPVPSVLLVAAAALLNKKSLSQRLCGNLQVDIDKNRALLGWSPKMTLDEGIKLTAEYYLGRDAT